jgi:hypothetical protein
VVWEDAMSDERRVQKVAFESEDRGFTVRASYLEEPDNRDALVEVFKDGAPHRRFLFPAYKVWNIAAHFADIVDGELEGTTDGYSAAAWDGLSGAVTLVPTAAAPSEGG